MYFIFIWIFIYNWFIFEHVYINFSFFFTRLIIDGGNILATALYNKLSADGHGLGITGLSGQIMNSLNLQSLINVNLIKASGQTNAIIAVILSIIITCLAIWAFLYGAILFLLRNVMLIFLLAVSPIGFIAGTLPWVKEKSSEWWSALTQQVVMAPFFLFMIYMVIKLVRGLGTSSILGLNLTGGIKTYFTDATALNYAMFIQAFLIIGALLVGTRMTKKMAGKMGGVAEKIVSAAVFAATTAATAGLAAPMAAGATATGANWVTRGVKMASGGSKMGRIGGSVLQKAGTIMTNAGQMKKTLDTATNSSGFLGRTLTAGKKGIFSAVKKETGVDIDFAGQAKKDKKEDDKRAGETLNEINSTKTDEEIANLEAKRKNIADRAEDEINGIVNENQDIKDLDRYLKENAKTTSALTEEINKLEKVIADNATSAADRAAAEIEKDTKKNEVSQFKKDANDLRTRRETIKKSVVSGLERIEVIEQRIADRTGYDLSKHDDKIEELKAKSRVERRAADEYIDRIESRKNIFGLEVGDPKLAAELRKLGAKKYKSKTKAEEYLAELEEKTKKDAEEEAKKASKTT